MSAITFDTLKFSRKLESAGFTREQSAGIAEAVAEVHVESQESVATKGDIRELKSELKSDMKELELRMTIKLGMMHIASIGLLLAALKYLGH
jgi:hypothetical protein